MIRLETRANQGIKKGDLVKVIAGKEKNNTGKVLKIITSQNRVIIERLNLVKRHQKPNAQNQQGGIIEKEAPIHLSNVALVEKTPASPATAKKTAKVSKKKSKEA